MTRPFLLPRPTWPNLLILGLGSRLVLILASFFITTDHCTKWAKTSIDQKFVQRCQTVERELVTPTRRPLLPWYRWDAAWYVDIATNGYQRKPGQQSSVAFLPMLPMVMATGAAVGLDPFWVGLIVPNLAFAVGLVAFGRIAGQITGDDATAWRACLLLVTFPTSFFFSAPYQESLGFALSAWGIWAWISHRPLAAASFLSLTTAARLACVATPVAIVAEWLADRVRRQRTRDWALPVAAAGGIGIMAFMVYLGYRFGNPMAHFKAHASWGRQAGSGGLVTFVRQFLGVCQKTPRFDLALLGLALFLSQPWLNPCLHRIVAGRGRQISLLLVLGVVVLGCLLLGLGGPARVKHEGIYLYRNLNDQRENLAFALFCGLGLGIWIRRGIFWGCLVLVPIAMGAITGSPLSMGRIVLMSFPAFIEAADLTRNRWLFLVILVGGVVGQALFLYRFTEMIIFVG